MKIPVERKKHAVATHLIPKPLTFKGKELVKPHSALYQ